MTADRLREILARLGWSVRFFAAQLGCSEPSAKLWAAGRRTIPPLVGDWLEALTAAHEAHPPPADWRRPRFGRAA